MKLKSDQEISVSHACAKRTRDASTVEHRAVLEQRDVQRVVHVDGTGGGIFPVRDFCQTLRSGWPGISSEGGQEIPLAAPTNSTFPPSDSVRNSRRTALAVERKVRYAVRTVTVRRGGDHEACHEERQNSQNRPTA